jgi:hypothetical protein
VEMEVGEFGHGSFLILVGKTFHAWARLELKTGIAEEKRCETGVDPIATVVPLRKI